MIVKSYEVGKIDISKYKIYLFYGKNDGAKQEEIEKLKAENDKLKVQLAESPADSPVNTNKFSSEKPVLTKTQYNRLSPQERFLYNLNK